MPSISTRGFGIISLILNGIGKHLSIFKGALLSILRKLIETLMKSKGTLVESLGNLWKSLEDLWKSLWNQRGSLWNPYLIPYETLRIWMEIFMISKETLKHRHPSTVMWSWPLSPSILKCIIFSPTAWKHRGPSLPVCPHIYIYIYICIYIYRKRYREI